MMQKLMSYKKIIICACAAAAVIAVATVALLTNKEESYRSILVYEVQGSAVIERASVGTMDAAENLYLESGDRVSVAADSGVRLKLDDDKYVMAEANTIFSVQAEGTDADSKTKICLEQGAVTNEIQHPLSGGSSYETSTPNSVMAVRGTIYRVESYVDENGDLNTKLCCFQGNVGTKPVLADGTYGEEVSVSAGSELTVYQDGTVSGVEDIAYDALPVQAVETLIGLMENGQSLTGISLEELTQLVSEPEEISRTAESESGQAQQSETNQGQQSETAETAAENDAEKETDERVQAKADTAKKAPIKSVKKEQETPAAQTPAPAQTPPAKETKPADSGSTGGSSGDGNSGSHNGGSGQDKPSQPDKPDKPAKPATYTVTFMYGGEVFATQKVKSGETATAPLLAPDQSGEWDFDFEAKIKANTTVSWK